MASIIRTWPRITGLSAREKKSFFIKNGSELYKGLLASCDGKYHPFRNFTAEEIISMTNNFAEPREDPGHSDSMIYMGCFENREVLIRMSFPHYSRSEYMFNDIVFTSRVSYHKNILKLLGCCLEFVELALVYEYPSRGELLSDLIYDHTKFEPLRWKSRLRIARDIAGVLVYLHTAFPTPIIYKDLKTDTIFVDEFGVAKLFDFSISIPLPPGKLEMEDKICGTFGFAEPEYVRTGIVTTKVDVYSFGVILLVLLTGQRAVLLEKGWLVDVVADTMNESFGQDRLKKIADPILLSIGIGDTEYGQMQACLELVEVAKELKSRDHPRIPHK